MTEAESKILGAKKSAAMDSPMEIVFSWNCSIKGNKTIDRKNKSEEDSGYFTTPCSSQSKNGTCSEVNTPEEGYFNPIRARYSSPFEKLEQISECGSLKEMGASESVECKNNEFLSRNQSMEDEVYHGIEDSLYKDCCLYPITPCKGSCDESTTPLPVSPETMKTIGSDVSDKLINCFDQNCCPLNLKKKRSKKNLTPVKSQSRVRDLPNRKIRSSSGKKQKKISLRIHMRSLVGEEFVDFLYQLGIKSNFRNILSHIFKYMSEEDVSNMTMVSKSWYQICTEIPCAEHKWKKYVRTVSLIKENRPMVSTKESPLSPLTVVNHSTPFARRTRSPPVSPSKLRFHLFQKEAAKLSGSEQLTPCPTCTLPARVTPENKLGLCTRISCRMRFCTSCRSPYHSPSPCPSIGSPSTPHKSRRHNKHFLRRL